jgi:hypothetical protein
MLTTVMNEVELLAMKVAAGPAFNNVRIYEALSLIENL